MVGAVVPVIMITARDPQEIKADIKGDAISTLLAKNEKDFLAKLTVAVQKTLPK